MQRKHALPLLLRKSIALDSPPSTSENTRRIKTPLLSLEKSDSKQTQKEKNYHRYHQKTHSVR